MKITPTLTALLSRTAGPARDFLQTLSPGQTLQARVVDLPSSGTARLQIGLMELLAQTRAPLSPGQTLELEVKQLKPLPELKILNPPPSRPPSEQVLQQALPRQSPVSALLRELQALVRPEPTRTGTTPGSGARPADTPMGPRTLPSAAATGLRSAPDTAAPPQVRPAAADPATSRGRSQSPPAAGGKATGRTIAGQAVADPAAAQTPRPAAAPPSATAPAPGRAPTRSPSPAAPTTPPPSSNPTAAPASAPRHPAGSVAGRVAGTVANPAPATRALPGATGTVPANPSSPGSAPARPDTRTPAPAGTDARSGTPTPARAPADPSPPPAPTRPAVTSPPPQRETGTSGIPAPSAPAAATRPLLAQLPKPLQLAVRQLLRPVPQAQQLNGTEVRDQLRESGLFLERQLAGGVIPKTDYKLDMLRLIQALTASRAGLDGVRPNPGEAAPTSTGPRPPAAAVTMPPPPEMSMQAHHPIPAVGSVTVGLTEQLLRLLTGAGRRPGGTPRATGAASTPQTGSSTPGVQTPTAAAPLDPGLRAGQPLRSMRTGKEPVSGQGEATRGGDATGNPVTAVHRALTERLLQLVEGGLARVQTHQAATLAEAEDGRQAWQFELPLARGQEREEVLVRLEGEAIRQGSGAERRWTATLRFAFDGLGSVEARLLLEGERLSSTFWCERPETEQRFARRLPELEQGLQRVGLEIGRLSAVQGTPPYPLDLPKPPNGLLDTHV